MRNLSALRKEYTKNTLTKKSVQADPVAQFKLWLNEAIDNKVLEPNAMHLATNALQEGAPSSRIVLLKGCHEGKFFFYTNYQSRKGQELDHNPACSLTFFWPELERQVLIKGLAVKTSVEVSDAYFSSRPRGSQLGAWTSPQSTMVNNRVLLEERKKIITHRYEGQKKVPRPAQWGGYQVDPYEMEFWQGRKDRIHDRIIYHRQQDQWIINRLAP